MSNQRIKSTYKNYMHELDDAIMELLTNAEDGGLTRPMISRKLDVPKSTVYDHLMKLKRAGFVNKYSKKRGRMGRYQSGRPSVMWYEVVKLDEDNNG